MNQPNSQSPADPAIPPARDEPAADTAGGLLPQPDATAIGELVICWDHDRPMQYGGPSDGPWDTVSIEALSKTAPVIRCDFRHVAPADTPIPAQDTRVTVVKRPRDEMPYGAAGPWKLTLPGVTRPSWHRTKREGTAAGLRQLAILGWHAARSAQAGTE